MALTSHIFSQLNSGLSFYEEYIYIHYSGSQMTCWGVGVQMLMNMNFEWIASFPGRESDCGFFQFPGAFSRVPNCYQTCLKKHFFAGTISNPVILSTRAVIISVWEQHNITVCLLVIVETLPIVKISALLDRGRGWSVTLGQNSDMRPFGWTAQLSSAVEWQ